MVCMVSVKALQIFCTKTNVLKSFNHSYHQLELNLIYCEKNTLHNYFYCRCLFVFSATILSEIEHNFGSKLTGYINPDLVAPLWSKPKLHCLLLVQIHTLLWLLKCLCRSLRTPYCRVSGWEKVWFWSWNCIKHKTLNDDITISSKEQIITDFRSWICFIIISSSAKFNYCISLLLYWRNWRRDSLVYLFDY